VVLCSSHRRAVTDLICGVLCSVWSTGKEGLPPHVPPNAKLLFDCTLLSFRPRPIWIKPMIQVGEREQTIYHASYSDAVHGDASICLANKLTYSLTYLVRRLTVCDIFTARLPLYCISSSTFRSPGYHRSLTLTTRRKVQCDWASRMTLPA
jgi:hypothetical protein